MRNCVQPVAVSLVELFNRLGRREFGNDWSGEEAAAIRLGRRSETNPRAYSRGKKVITLMREMAEVSSIKLIYTDHARARIPYGSAPGYWLTNIFPDQHGTGEGFIELDDRETYPCFAVVGRTAIRDARSVKQGRPRQFAEFDAALDALFTEFPQSTSRKEIIHALTRTFQGEWPKRTTVYFRIDEAIQRAKARVRL